MIREEELGATKQNTDPATRFLLKLPEFVRELIAGGAAGAAAKTCVAPLERTKILFQTGGLHGSSVSKTLVMLFQAEGIRGLYKGNGASVLRIVPYAAIHFSTYEYYRRLITESVAPSLLHTAAGRVHPVWDLLAGSTAGATAVMLTYPLDVVRARLAFAIESSPRNSMGPAAATASPPSAGHLQIQPHLGIRGALLQTAQQEGLLGLYRGLTPTLLGILPYAGLKFYVYQSMKHSYRHWQVTAGHGGGGAAAGTAPSAGQLQSRDGERLPVGMMLAFGGMSGLLAQTVTYPLDLVRRRMQVQGAPGAHASITMAATFREIWGEGRLLAFFRGLSINYMKVVPSTAIGFTIYDALKFHMQLKGNL